MALQLPKRDPLLGSLPNIPQVTAGMNKLVPSSGSVAFPTAAQRTQAINDAQAAGLRTAQAATTRNNYVNPLQFAAGEVGNTLYGLTLKPTVDTAESFGKGLGYAFGGGAKAALDASNQAYNDIVAAHDAFNKGKISQSTFGQLLRQAAQTQTGLVGTGTEISQEVDPVRQAANAAVLAATAFTAGKIPEIKGIVGANPTIGGRILSGAVNAAPYGTVFGGLGAAQDLGRNVTPGDIAGGAAAGTVGAAALGGAIPALSTAARTVFRKLTEKTPEGVAADAAKAKVSLQPDIAGTESLPSKLKAQLKQKFVDADQPILDQLRRIEKATGQEGLVDRFMYNSNMQRGSNARANVELRTGDNFNAAIGKLDSKAYDQFSTYANARTELASASPRQRKLSQPRKELQAIVDGATPEMQQRFTALNAHYKSLAKVARDAGVISKQTYDRYTGNDNYIRLQRDMGDLVQQPHGNNSYNLRSTILRQKRKGSRRATMPAGETAAHYTQQIYREATKNRTGQHLASTLVKAKLARRVSPNAAKNENTIKVFENGKEQHYLVSAEIKKAVDNIQPYQMNIAMRILAVPGRVARAGITGLNPIFIARNLFKDQVGSAINSEHLAATHLTGRAFAEGLYGSVKSAVGANKDPIWLDFQKHYGDVTSYDLTRNIRSTKDVVNRVRGGKAQGLVQSLAHPIQSLEALASVTEKSTRFQQYIGEYRKAIRDGLPKEQASERAAMAAWQNSVDFTRAGEWGRVINTVIPYWNPSTQGVRQMFRTFSKHPVKSAFTATAVVGLPIAAATAWNLSTPENQVVYNNIPEYEKDNNLILIPPGTKQNQDGTYDVLKIPLPPGIKDLFMPVRRTLEAFANDKPADAGKIAGDILQAISGPVNVQNGAGGFAGSFTPQAVKPFVQQAANQDLFSGKQIVPDYINQATDAGGNPIPESQKAQPYSSGTAKQIGGLLGVSPIRVEKFIKDTAGTVGLEGLNIVDTAQANAGTISKDNIGGQSIPEGFKQSFFSAQGIDNKNKSVGAKYFDNVKVATAKLNQNEQAAFNSLHPTKNNFLGDQLNQINSIYNPAAKLDIYNRFPAVFAADKALDTKARADGQAGNPLFDLTPEQVKKVLERDNLPPGAKDPELSTLTSKDWYVEYAAKKSAFFDQIAKQAEAQGKTLGAQDNPYPVTAQPIQKIMDAYTALPKGTGARSSWIKAHPTEWGAMQQQFAAIDNWQNIQRGKRGLAPTEGATGTAAGFPTVSLDSGNTQFGGGSGAPSSGGTRAVSLSSGGTIAKPKVTSGKSSKVRYTAAPRRSSKPRVKIRKSAV